ncbi:MAG TPA: glycosyltransferase family 4 protein, partial [Pararhizobium sp.]|nr:glycosyltransferase family 4 protein [Pararhizobium sp.]
RENLSDYTFVNGQSFDLVSETAHKLSHVISDHGSNLDFAESMIGSDLTGKAHTIYAECALPAKTKRTMRRPTKKLFWASRIDDQKRPELLARIARLLEKSGLDISIDAYGETTYGKIGPEVFEGASLLHYKGGFDGFDTLPVDDYDGFLYTAAFDGLPNVVLEALASALPVIAPDVGGIGEAVTDQTGYLIEDDPDPDFLAERFIDAIKALYDDWPEAVRRGENGRKLIAERHSREAFLKRVAEVFELGPAEVPLSSELQSAGKLEQPREMESA